MQRRVLEMLAAVLAAGSAPEFAVVERWLAPAEPLVVVVVPVLKKLVLEELVPEELAPVELVLRWSPRW